MVENSQPPRRDGRGPGAGAVGSTSSRRQNSGPWDTWHRMLLYLRYLRVGNGQK